MLLSDWLLFFDKTIIALSGRHFEYFFTFSQNNYTCLRPSVVFYCDGVRLGFMVNIKTRVAEIGNVEIDGKASSHFDIGLLVLRTIAK